MTFSGFTFSDFSHDGDASDVDVRVTSFLNFVALEFTFEDLFSSPVDETSLGGRVDVTVTDPNLVLVGQSLALGRITHDFDAFLSVVSASTDALSVTDSPSFSDPFASGALGGTTYSDAWDARTENTGGGFGVTSLDSLVWTFELDTLPAPVPLPASVLMLGLGMAGLGAMRRRKHTRG